MVSLDMVINFYLSCIVQILTHYHDKGYKYVFSTQQIYFVKHVALKQRLVYTNFENKKAPAVVETTDAFRLKSMGLTPHT